jgi:hypothetical protein
MCDPHHPGLRHKDQQRLHNIITWGYGATSPAAMIFTKTLPLNFFILQLTLGNEGILQNIIF